MKSTIAICAAVLALTGCAANQPRQIIDMRGVDSTKYYKDHMECSAYASQVDVGGSAINNAVGNALVGAVIGGIVGGRDGALFGAKVFGVTGAVDGVASATHDKQTIMTRCMTGRGYSVLL